MTISPQKRLALVWLLLSVVTLLAWWLGANDPEGSFEPDPVVAVGAIAITMVKVRFIIAEFMDLRHAPLLFRRGADAWLVCFSAAMLAAYFLTG